MAMKLKPLQEQVIVITGGTSGIGLATVRAAAKQGAKLVIAARGEQDLKQLEQEITAAGGQAATVVADVSNEEDVRRIAQTAIDRFGRFDTWINDVGVSIWGRIEDLNIEDFRRLMDVTFWSQVYGSREAAKHLKTRGGAINNLGSVASEVAFPLQGMYCAAKHAVKAFTDSLRMELEKDGAPISVTLIKPAGINTPFPKHSGNFMEQESKLPPPVYPPEEVAHAILHAATHPIRDIYVGGAGPVLSGSRKMAPRTTDYYMEHSMFDQQQRDQPAGHRLGALYVSGGGLREHGDYPGHVMKTSVYTRAKLHPWITGMMLGAAGVAVAGIVGAERARRK